MRDSKLIYYRSGCHSANFTTWLIMDVIVQDVNPAISDLPCYWNRETSKSVGLQSTRKLSCLWNGVDVYLPFNFIKNYFEIFGAFSLNHGVKEFDVSHSNSRVLTPSSRYNPREEFMHFASFDVEGRSRVLCVSAGEGVPLSTQWNPQGYFYPTQIAQFALAHYSVHSQAQHRENIKRYTIQLEQEDTAARVRDEDTNSLVIQFKNTLEFALSSPHLVLSLDLKINSDIKTWFKVQLLAEEEGELFTLLYTQSGIYIQSDGSEFQFGFGNKASGRWLRLTRDLFTDLKKGLTHSNDKKKAKKLKRTKLKVISLKFYGSGNVANISLSDGEDLRMFLDGANWFLENQDENGGWPSNVIFNQGQKKYPKAAEIQPGWYGAMCQGQAISVLSRAYHVTRDQKYLTAAEAALGPFQKPVAEGGVKTVFLDRYDWYEEYPTNPSTFILNGFMYSLIGLYDLQNISPDNVIVQLLFKRGMRSLLALLPFYDAGSATFYDLRHFTMQTAPKIARWDYHTTHINQLLLLATIQNSTVLSETAERWRGYMVGKRAPHN
ncbi:D-glucuronyl C5-epimerase [Eurytemora carolleeae]|uniref:D-glucuronyl C5-epimerase n=1 Tax=Eurytemora carolleeae TaxID=1294199 RepID=UPI000C760BF3|nr:D-glucuronyl C5-epimerase [Eurytemora carolleeae]|eukprot:XP_023326953.1 D-glucuronyl C5-epimerase-like [Eurytemora affinis]